MTWKGVFTLFGQLSFPSIEIAGSNAQVSFYLGRALGARFQKLERLKFELARVLSGLYFSNRGTSYEGAIK